MELHVVDGAAVVGELGHQLAGAEVPDLEKQKNTLNSNSAFVDTWETFFYYALQWYGYTHRGAIL